MRQGRRIGDKSERAQGPAQANDSLEKDPRPTPISPLRVEAEVAPHADPSAAHECRRIALDWLQQQMGSPLPRRAMAHRSFSHTGGDSACRAVRIRDARGDFWAAQLERTPYKGQATVAEVVVAQPEGSSPLVRMDVVDRSVVPTDPNAEYPAEMLAEMAERVPLLQGGRTLSHTPIVVESVETMQGFHRMLVDPGRKMPFAVVSVPPDIDNLDALEGQWAALARALTGLALVWVLPPKMTYRLSDLVTKSLSVFLGAWRFYRPGFNHLADRNHHPLVLRNRMEDDRGVRETMRQFLNMAVQERMRTSFRTRLPIGYDDLVREEVAGGRGPGRLVAFLRDSLRNVSGEPSHPGYASASAAGGGRMLTEAHGQQAGSVRPAVREPTPSASETGTATPTETARERRPRKSAEASRTQARRYREARRRADRAERERDDAVNRANKLADMVRALGGDPDAVTRFPTAWEQFEPWCEEHLGECVSLSRAARQELSNAEFEDVGLAARCIHWLAHHYRDECLRGGNPRPRGRIDHIGNGVVNRPCDADCIECNWGGQNRRVEWCLQCGADARDPRRCLRIYYFWDDDTQRVVVASMPQGNATVA